MDRIMLWVALVYSVDPEADEGVQYLGLHDTEHGARAVLGRWCRDTLREEGGSPWREDEGDEGPEVSFWARPGQRRRLLGDEESLDDALETYFETHPAMRYIIWSRTVYVENGQVLT